MKNNIIQIKKFNPLKLKAGEDVCLIIGKRNTGKSYLLKDLLYYMHSKFDIASVFSKTEHLNKFYEKFVPKMLINMSWDEKKLEKIFERQDAMLKKGNISNIALIFDDMISDSVSWKNNEYIKKIFLEGRHHHIGFFLLTQYVNAIPPFGKINSDYIFILQQQNFKEKERLYDEFGGMFENKKLFFTILDNLTENYGCMVIDNKSKSNKLEDRVFGYRAKETIPNYRMCSNELWGIQRRKEIQMTYINTSKNSQKIVLPKSGLTVFKEFEPKKINPISRFFLIGKTNTGKSYLLRDLLFHLKNSYYTGVVCSRSEEVNHFYKRFIPKSCLYPDHSEVLLKDIFTRQKKLINNNVESKYSNFFLIYDDLISGANEWGKCSLIKDTYTLGRHYKIAFFLLSQYTNAVPPYAKNNVDYIFILQQQNYQEIDRLYKEYGSGFKHKKEFIKVLETFTNNNGCMVIDNTIKSTKIQDRIFFYKASAIPPEFRMCHKNIWK